jgi:uncharacterized protein (DUF2252 family)
MVFSLNDFDETLPGPFEWDVKRLVASFAVAGRDRGFNERQRQAVNLTVARSYRESMAQFASMRTLELWYTRLDVEEFFKRVAPLAKAKETRRAEQNLAKARTKDNLKAFSKLTHMVDGEPRIINDPPLIVPIEDVAPGHAHELEAFVQGVLRSYRRTLSNDRRHLLERYRYVHAARKVVGVGSVGTQAWVALLLGRDDGDPLFLQFKEADPSVLEPFLGKSEFTNHGRRVVEGQRLAQAASDIMLGWIRTDTPHRGTQDLYVRQLWDAKGSAIVETMTPRLLTFYAQVCGWSLAKAHARSGDPIAMSSYMGANDAFDRALASFAETYADQNERDYAALQAAVASGRIKAETGL